MLVCDRILTFNVMIVTAPENTGLVHIDLVTPVINSFSSSSVLKIYLNVHTERGNTN